MARQIAELPHALAQRDEIAARLAGKRPAVFLDYDGTLTPIVDWPDDAIMSESMRDAVRRLAHVCTVCVVSGRDRQVLQELMGVDDLVVAGSHGFDVWTPARGAIEWPDGARFDVLMGEVEARLREAMRSIEGALIEPKTMSIAAHYRLASDEDRQRIKGIVDALIAEHPEELRVMAGKMVWEIQPRVDWDKGKAVLYLLKELDLDHEDVMPIYLGDDITDEHAFEALADRGIGIFVGRADDPEVAGRSTSANYALHTVQEVEQFLHLLAQWTAGGPGAPERAQSPLRPQWTLAYETFEPQQEGLREALTSTGNGYFCTRGAAEWADVDEVHYPGTYTHSGYNRETTILGGRPILNEDLVNLPNWLVLKLRIEGGEPIARGNVEILNYRHELDVRNATVQRTMRFRDRAGRETTLASRRFISLADMHQAAIEWTITPENWSGKVQVITALDGRVTNQGVVRYRQLEGRHLHPVGSHHRQPHVISLLVRTRQSRIHVAEAARTRVYEEGRELNVERELYHMEDYIHQTLTFEVAQGKGTRVEKMVAFYTSRDHAINESLVNAEKAIGRYGTFAEAFERHAQAWDEVWADCDVRLPRDEWAQLLLRTHISHVLQVCSRYTADLDAGVPARGLNGEAYRGHVFWDELYIFPFLNFRRPRITRQLLMYRHRRLDEARAMAREAGYRGAMYPWQSGSDGKEETQVVHLNPLSGLWHPDVSHKQRHVNAAIFYNLWRYHETVCDPEFLLDCGAEVMLEIARFWSSIAHFNPDRDRYEIHGVMGPDEFHERYPGADEAGLRNNAYTNVMVAWIADAAVKLLDMLPGPRRLTLWDRIQLTTEEVETWTRLSRKMFVPFHGDGIISQFEGYADLLELDWETYRERYGNIQRLDRILRSEGDDPNRYKVSKQADAVLLFFLFSVEELRQIFERLDYSFTPDMVHKNVFYYDRRTSHGSTLSLVAYAGILANLDPGSSWDRYMAALESDVSDVQGGTTKEGIHMGSMSGTLDLIQRAYLGSAIRGDTIYFCPKRIDKLDGLSLPMSFRGMRLAVRLQGRTMMVTAQADSVSRSVKVGVGRIVKEINAGESQTFDVWKADEAV